MALKPFDLPAADLFAEADPQVDYFSAIVSHALDRFEQMASQTIRRMQRFRATGIFEGEATGLRSLWDEWCWYRHHHTEDGGLLSAGMEHAVYEMTSGVIAEHSGAELTLLSCAASEDQQHMPARDDDAIRTILTDMLTGAAMRRSMRRFEVW